MASDCFQKKIWTLAHGRHLEIGARAQIMGVLNVTPDSFSDGGEFVKPEVALQKATTMIEQGASIVDVGGESTRPGADQVNGETERARVLPIIAMLSERTEAIISIDTYRAQSAREAVEAGAHIINDVWGCQKEPDLAQVAADTGAGLCIMHTGRERDVCDDVIADQVAFLRKSLSIARAAGVRDEQIVLDPGFGFAKDTQLNLQLLNRLDEIVDLGFPVLVGTSRKRFLGEITGREAMDRGMATAATSVIARQKGAAIFRVHDIVENRDALAVADALIKCRQQ
ncbi:dihydropteroate synthase [Ahrensia sp. AH-315-G08]|nr:dihydropteroate synthase [Ahrensia sp. AH-315-G08]